MSGSGAAAFGIFTTMDAAERAAGRLQQAKPGWWVTSAKTGAS
jgi:4-diphosphocytidyl-2-C-methyl-D-erythritol kinase